MEEKIRLWLIRRINLLSKELDIEISQNSLNNKNINELKRYCRYLELKKSGKGGSSGRGGGNSSRHSTNNNERSTISKRANTRKKGPLPPIEL
ncbi:MAG: hypothetical protein K2P52_09310 [Campylobacterales bacterium]|nr:hypothetical protein [Campylobacterales bacterium]